MTDWYINIFCFRCLAACIYSHSAALFILLMDSRRSLRCYNPQKTVADKFSKFYILIHTTCFYVFIISSIILLHIDLPEADNYKNCINYGRLRPTFVVVTATVRIMVTFKTISKVGVFPHMFRLSLCKHIHQILSHLDPCHYCIIANTVSCA